MDLDQVSASAVSTAGEVIFEMLAIKKHYQSKFKRKSNSHELVSHYFFEIACSARLLIGGKASLNLCIVNGKKSECSKIKTVFNS